MTSRGARPPQLAAIRGGPAGVESAPRDTGSADIDAGGLTPDRALVDALAVGLSWKEAASIARVSRSTVARRARDARFRHEVETRRGELVDAVVGQIVASGELAVLTLRELATRGRSEQARLGAASRLLDHLRLPARWEPGIDDQHSDVDAWLRHLTEEAS
jgi:hypothetical protein